MRIYPDTDIPRTNPNPPDPLLHAEYPRELLWQKEVERMFRQLGWETQHFWNTMRSRPGFPDLMCWRVTKIFWPAGSCERVNGRLLIAELKTETGAVVESQRATMLNLAATGVPTYLWRPSDMDEIVEVLSSNETAP